HCAAIAKTKSHRWIFLFLLGSSKSGRRASLAANSLGAPEKYLAGQRWQRSLAKRAFITGFLHQLTISRTPSNFPTSHLRRSAPYIFLCLALRRRLTFSITSRTLPPNSTPTCRLRFEAINN